MTRFTYQHLLELVEGDDELIALLVEEGEITRGDDDVVTVDVDRVLVARTLLRDLEVSWPGIEVVLRLRGELLRLRGELVDVRAELAEARKHLADRDRG
jgi:hypothetical protein